ncbi:MAG: TonB-dependent receptor [Gemmatimonadetes bacterium]|nr:TonB-dependent receptor [Gemmatimonadota bacterium]
MILIEPKRHPNRKPSTGVHPLTVTRGVARAACATVLILLGSSRPGQAQAHPQSPDTIRSVLEPLVARVAIPEVLGSSSALVVDLDSAGAPPSVSLADMLRAMPLVRVRDNSRGETHITLRGSESRQVSVSLDGIPLTIGWDNRADLSVIPLTGVTKLTAIRGLSSLLAGPNVLGGVIQVGVAPAYVQPDSPGSVRARGGVGTGGSLAADLSVQRRFGGGSGGGLLRAGGGYRQWDYQRIGKSIEQPPSAVPGEQINSDISQWNAFVAGRVQGSAGEWLSLSSVAFGAERGVAPELHVAGPRLWRLPVTRRWVTVLGAGMGWHPEGGGSGSVSLRGAIDFGRFEIDEYDSTEYEVVTGREIGDDQTFTLKADGSQSLGWGKLDLSLTGAETRHDETLDPSEQNRFRQRLFSGAAELAIPLWAPGDDSGLALLVGGSLDGSDTPQTGGRASRSAIWDWGGKAAATLGVPAVGGRVHAGISRRTRAPSLRELYSGALGRFVVNPALGPETLVAAEIGLTGGGSKSQWQVVGFHHRLSGGIVRTSAGDGRFQRVNRDRVLATGLELIGGIRWKAVVLDGDLTLQDVAIEDPAAPTDERQPEYQPSVAANLEFGVRLPAAVLARLRVSYVGRQYCVHPDLERDVHLDEAAWGGIELGRSWTLGRGPRARALRVTGGVHNLTDASVYDQCGLPASGRQFTLTIGVG